MFMIKGSLKKVQELESDLNNNDTAMTVTATYI